MQCDADTAEWVLSKKVGLAQELVILELCMAVLLAVKCLWHENHWV